VAMSALDRGRLGVAAGAVGVGQACLDASVAYARTRRQFGQRIGDFQMIQATLADMAADLDAARLLVYRAAWLKDAGRPATREISIAKLFATEGAAAWQPRLFQRVSRGALLPRHQGAANLRGHKPYPASYHRQGALGARVVKS
jgi:alkylation response protein AidB-like acyl-CoA dehydrogenase